MYTPLTRYLKQAKFPILIEEISPSEAYDMYIEEYNSLLRCFNINLNFIKKEKASKDMLILALLETLATREHLLRITINGLLKKLIISPFIEEIKNNQTAIDEIIRLFGMKRSAIPVMKKPVQFESDEQILKKLSSRFEILSSTGTIGAYKHHLLNLDSRIIDVNINIINCDSNKLNIYLLINKKISNNEESEKFILEIEDKIKKQDLKCLRDEFSIKIAKKTPIYTELIINKNKMLINKEIISQLEEDLNKNISDYFNHKNKLNSYISHIELADLLEDKNSLYIKNICFSYEENLEKTFKEVVFEAGEAAEFKKVKFTYREE